VDAFQWATTLFGFWSGEFLCAEQVAAPDREPDAVFLIATYGLNVSFTSAREGSLPGEPGVRKQLIPCLLVDK
jgi:hypothetical protein